MTTRANVQWHDSGREPQCAPDPAFPHGKDIWGGNDEAPSCKVELPYPAKRCGYYIVECERCGYRLAVTTAGRADDPRSVRLPCNSTLAVRQ